jgi:ATP synthase protein I
MNDTTDDQKLIDLEKKIEAAMPQGESQDSESEKNKNIGMRAGSTFVSCVVAGGIIGFLCDKGLGTMPLFLLIFLFAGFGFGIFRAAKIMAS